MRARAQTDWAAARGRVGCLAHAPTCRKQTRKVRERARARAQKALIAASEANLSSPCAQFACAQRLAAPPPVVAGQSDAANRLPKVDSGLGLCARRRNLFAACSWRRTYGSARLGSFAINSVAKHVTTTMATARAALIDTKTRACVCI